MKKHSKILVAMLSFMIFILSISLVACNKPNDGGDVDNGNDEEDLAVVDDYSNDYYKYIDFRKTPEVSYYFKPAYSGYYVFTSDLLWEDCPITTTVDGSRNLQNGDIAFYNNNQMYRIDCKGFGSDVALHMSPATLDPRGFEIQPGRELIVKHFIDKTGFYKINTNATQYKILHLTAQESNIPSKYAEIASQGNNVFYLCDWQNNSCYITYIVLYNTSTEKLTVDFSIEKLDTETIVLGKENSMTCAKKINGQVGENQFYIVDSEIYKANFSMKNVEGSGAVKFKLNNEFAARDYLDQFYNDYLEFSLNADDPLLCEYNCRFGWGKYILILEFENDISFDFYYEVIS